MAAESSFDIVSEVDMQLVENSLNNVRKEVQSRYDFKGSTAEVTLAEQIITVKAEDEYKVNTMADMLVQKAIKQGINGLFFDMSKPLDSSLGGNYKKEIVIRKGIDKEQAKVINNMIKEMKLKVNSQIQGEQIRVFSKDKDALQKVIQALRAAKVDIPLNFTNYR